MLSNAVTIEVSFATSAVKIKTAVSGYMDSICCLAAMRDFFVRAKIAIFEAPALAKALAIARPMPAPAPVTATFFPLAETLGRAGSMASYEALCQATGDGNGAGVMMAIWI